MGALRNKLQYYSTGKGKRRGGGSKQKRGEMDSTVIYFKLYQGKKDQKHIYIYIYISQQKKEFRDLKNANFPGFTIIIIMG